MMMGQPTYRTPRIWKSAEIRLHDDIENVFPLFTPIGEMKWVKDWNPQFIYPADGATEEQMVFVTSPRFDDENPYCWVMSKLDRQDHHVEYLVFGRDRVWNIDVTCVATGNITRATITYRFTPLSERGRELNETALHQMYLHELKDWEEAINKYLRKENQPE